MKKLGTLYIIPTSLSDNVLVDIYPERCLKVIRKLNHFVVETPKIGRGFLRGLNKDRQVNTMTFYTVNENVDHSSQVLSQLNKGVDVGLMSDAGVPGVADSGSKLILEAHNIGITVFPIPIGSSLTIALSASGLNGQRFTFNGYLPKEQDKRIRRIRELESVSKTTNSSQLFIETPYRSQYIFEDIIKVCGENTHLHISADLEYETQISITRSIKDWKKENVDLTKRRVVYILQV